MKISYKKILWFIFSILASAYVGYCIFEQSEKLSPLLDLLATIVLIFIGILPATFAVLSSRKPLGSGNYSSNEERNRIEKVLKNDDKYLIDGQNIILWSYYLTLILYVIFKWLIATNSNIECIECIYNLMHIKIISGILGFVASVALLWSTTIPSLLGSIYMQRKDLE
jgi:hypothetical protein